MMKRFAHRAVCVVAAIAMCGCASTERDMDVPYEITLHVADDANLGVTGKPSPILVGLYELKSTGAFEAASFPTLQDRAKDALGEDLVFTQQLIMQPGETKTLRRPGGALATQLGIVAGYRLIDKRLWKQTVALAPPKSTNLYKVWQFSPRTEKIAVEITRQSVTVTLDKR
ncbi:type VI secretion system lipoprotein TssJ [Caballeronia sp. LZ034LL]|uniref:type VI secretion system lipoprotein TssJ n=1 Tax=Caballeronia sp. LZ034LL TaxID=3038567 RepID=UPI002866DC0C|nr:type VI secretion system lipoprotein TssJ [Caballeronia sp. LZ034LL]MDR5836407.1 type VI secretion system lipoprotein TssJ [Caballeronia sp. LZ034LL]